MSHLPYKKHKNPIWERSIFYFENLAKSYKIMKKFEISKSKTLHSALISQTVLEWFINNIETTKNPFG